MSAPSHRHTAERNWLGDRSCGRRGGETVPRALSGTAAKNSPVILALLKTARNGFPSCIQGLLSCCNMQQHMRPRSCSLPISWHVGSAFFVHKYVGNWPSVRSCEHQYRLYCSIRVSRSPCTGKLNILHVSSDRLRDEYSHNE